MSNRINTPDQAIDELHNIHLTKREFQGNPERLNSHMVFSCLNGDFLCALANALMNLTGQVHLFFAPVLIDRAARIPFPRGLGASCEMLRILAALLFFGKTGQPPLKTHMEAFNV